MSDHGRSTKGVKGSAESGWLASDKVRNDSNERVRRGTTSWVVDYADGQDRGVKLDLQDTE